MGKKKWYIHTVKYSLALKKKGNPVTCNNMNEPRVNYAKFNEAGTKERIFYNSTYISGEVRFIETESKMAARTEF